MAYRKSIPNRRRSPPVRADDLILISVDDHINEPASMFDAHVPAKYQQHAPRIVDLDNGRQQWFYGEVRGRAMGLQAVAGKAEGVLHRRRQPFRRDATGLLRRR